MPYVPPKNDSEYSLKRLNGIMARRRLSFNPYTVSGKQQKDAIRRFPDTPIPED